MTTEASADRTTFDRPNVIVVLTDQQRWDTVGAYGNPMAVTPALDAVAERGTMFERTVSNQPVCGPARACLQTGQYATTHGVYRNSVPLSNGDHLLARRFADAGYETAYIGKWHLADTQADPVPADARAGYDHWRAADALEATSHPYEGIVYDEHGEQCAFDGYRVDALTDMAREFIRWDRNRPFLCFLSYLEPHQQNDLDDNRAYVAPDGYERLFRNPWVPPDLRGRPGDWSESLADYYGCCRRIDECFERLLGTLAEMGMREETIVLFTSDHGCHFRTRGPSYKSTPHESSVRVPGVLVGPGIPENRRIETPIGLVDFPPTVLDLAGLAVPDAMDGKSRVSLINSEINDAAERGVFIQTGGDGPGRALHTDRWKYAVIAPDIDPYEQPANDTYIERCLYDLRADPYENTNLIDHPEHEADAQRLRTTLRERILTVEGTAIEIRPRHTSHEERDGTN